MDGHTDAHNDTMTDAVKNDN